MVVQVDGVRTCIELWSVTKYKFDPKKGLAYVKTDEMNREIRPGCKGRTSCYGAA